MINQIERGNMIKFSNLPKAKKSNFFQVLYLALAVSLTLQLSSCDNKYEAKKPKDVETMNSGKLDIAVDNEYTSLLDSIFMMYKSDYPNVDLHYSFFPARQVMSDLFNRKNRAVIIGRDYLKDEDSILNIYNIKNHLRMKIADDALVFFTKTSSPFDTLNRGNLEKFFINQKINFEDVSGIKKLPYFFISEPNSSTYSNFLKLITNGESVTKDVKSVLNWQDVIKEVEKSDNNIGIAYLSQIALDSRFKMLKIGYDDSTELHIRPKIVHQSNVLRGYYPYKFPIYVYLLEDRQNLPFWFASYLAKETKAQKYFLNQGIVPGFAQIKLKFAE